MSRWEARASAGLELWSPTEECKGWERAVLSLAVDCYSRLEGGAALQQCPGVDSTSSEVGWEGAEVVGVGL